MTARRWTHSATAALAALAALAVTAVPAGAAEPALSASKAKLARALHCQPQVRDARRPPVMLVTGTGFTGREVWIDAGNAAAALRTAGHPACYVDFPSYTTADVQTSVEYLVAGIRREFRRAGRRIAVYGVSQGGSAAAVGADLLAEPAPHGQRRGVRGRQSPRHGL